MDDDSKRKKSWASEILDEVFSWVIYLLCLVLAASVFAPLLLVFDLFLSPGSSAALRIELGPDHWFNQILSVYYCLIFSAALLVGVYVYRRGWLKHLLDKYLQLTDTGWLILSRRCGFFLLFAAGLFACVRYYFTASFAENFEIFGSWGLIILFALSQFKLREKYKAHTTTRIKAPKEFTLTVAGPEENYTLNFEPHEEWDGIVTTTIAGVPMKWFVSSIVQNADESIEIGGMTDGTEGIWKQTYWFSLLIEGRPTKIEYWGNQIIWRTDYAAT